MDLGSNIRERRTAAGLTLDALSRESGVSRAMLSDLERNAKSPTIRILSQVAAGLGCKLSELLGEGKAERHGTVEVVRESEQQVLIDRRSGVERHVLSPAFLRRSLELVMYVIPPGKGAGTFPAHMPGTLEHITVVKGCLRCTLGDTQVTLEKGDSLSFSADITHAFENAGRAPCRYFLIIDSSQSEKR